MVGSTMPTKPNLQTSQKVLYESSKVIRSFRGEYSFLSNFHPCSVKLDNLVFPSVEHAFQAAKTIDPSERVMIKNLKTPKGAKMKGKKVKLRNDWESVKVGIMTELVYKKFKNDQTLKQKLLETGTIKLVEGNNWGDRFWGETSKGGRNILGKILMEVRRIL